MKLLSICFVLVVKKQQKINKYKGQVKASTHILREKKSKQSTAKFILFYKNKKPKTH